MRLFPFLWYSNLGVCERRYSLAFAFWRSYSLTVYEMSWVKLTQKTYLC